MTKLIRHAVSGKNRRYIDEDLDLDLDLTYITPRIVAMGYPSTGFESSYRNPAKEVSSLLESKHSGHYTVFNLTDRTYDASIFPSAQVLNFPFPDHHAPPFSLLIEILKKMDEIYKSEEESVLVIHCLAGHGRTGTVISSFLLYEDIYQTPEDALGFFARKRSYKDKGVSHPSQKRAVYYAYSYKQMMISEGKSIFSTPPKIQRRIDRIIFKNLFFENSSKNIQSIVLVLLDSKFEVIYDSSSLKLITPENSKSTPNTNDQILPFTYNATELCFNIHMTVEDDITVKVYKVPKLMRKQAKKKEIFRISFNMIFCNNFGVAFPKWDIDGPHKDINNEKFPSGMCVCIEMEPSSGQKGASRKVKTDNTDKNANNCNDNNNNSDANNNLDNDNNDSENNENNNNNNNNSDNPTNHDNDSKNDDENNNNYSKNDEENSNNDDNLPNNHDDKHDPKTDDNIESASK